MNKRFLSFIAAAALLLSAGACSNRNDANDPGQDLKDAGSNLKDAGMYVLYSVEDAAENGMDAVDDALDNDVDDRNDRNDRMDNSDNNVNKK